MKSIEDTETQLMERDRVDRLLYGVFDLLMGFEPGPDGRAVQVRPNLTRVGEGLGAHAMMWYERRGAFHGRVFGQFSDGGKWRRFSFDVHASELRDEDMARVTLLHNTLQHLGLWVTDEVEAWRRLAGLPRYQLVPGDAVGEDDGDE